MNIFHPFSLIDLYHRFVDDNQLTGSIPSELLALNIDDFGAGVYHAFFCLEVICIEISNP